MAIDPQAQPAPVDSDASNFTPPSISHLSNVAYLIGYPIAHSSSPALHDSISATSQFPYAQVLIETKDLLGALTYLRNHPPTPNFLGTGVTMPHKVAVLPHLDALTNEAEAVGAVNTIFFNRDPTNPDAPLNFIGHNTDTIGVRDAFRFNVSEDRLSNCRGRPALIIGGGGTCRAAIYALQQFLGCSKLYIVNRDASEVDAVLDECRKRNAADDLIHVSSVEQAEQLEAPGLIVSAVPDFPPKTVSENAVRDILRHFLRTQEQERRGALLEMCYHPSPDTQISKLAAEEGWQVIGGIEAMIGQGLEQSKLWTGVTVDETLRDAARGAVRPKH